jgi:hypothetical protein
MMDLQATRAELYLNAIERAQIALTNGELELVICCINEAQHAKYELEENVRRSEFMVGKGV